MNNEHETEGENKLDDCPSNVFANLHSIVLVFKWKCFFVKTGLAWKAKKPAFCSSANSIIHWPERDAVWFRHAQQKYFHYSGLLTSCFNEVYIFPTRIVNSQGKQIANNIKNSY